MESNDGGTQSRAALDDAADAAFDSAVPAEIAKLEAAEGSTPAVTSAPTSTETADAAGSTPVAEAKPVAPDTQDAPEYQNLLAKFNGNKNDAAKAYWAANNSASEAIARAEKAEAVREALAQELAALKGQGSTPKPGAQAEVKEIPTELRRYDDDMRRVETTFKATQAEQTAYVTERRRLANEILLTQRKWSSNDLTIDREALSAKLNELVGEQLAVDAYLDQLDTKLKGYDEKWQDIKDRRDIRAQLLDTAKELKAEREAKAKSDEERDSGAYVAQFSTSWNGTIEKVSKDPAIIPAVLSEEFGKYVRAMGKAYVADGTPIEDVAKFVSDAASEFMGGAKKFHQAQSADYAKLKKSDAAISSPEGANALASETKRPRADWTQAQWAAYEENISL